MITKERLQELIEDCCWKIQGETFTKKDEEIRDSLIELLTLREQIEEYEDTICVGQQRLDSQREISIKLKEQNAELLADGERLASCLRYHKFDGSVYYINAGAETSDKQHKELMEKYG